jgi:hypothetical protein
VMLVTAIFAGLLIHDRSRLSSQSAALPINMPPRPANGAPVLAQAKTVPAAEAPATTMRPQSVQVGGQVLAQAKTVPAAEAPATTMRPQSVQVGGPVPAQAETVPAAEAPATTMRPHSVQVIPPSVPQTPVVQAVPERRKDQPVSRVDVAIMAGGVCSSGEVVGLDPYGDNFLSVRSGPGGPPYREIDRLFSSDAVRVCDRKAPWFAVVYSTRKPQESCDIGAKGTRRPYMGPCQYGWVHSRYIKVNATENSGGR